MAYDAKLADSVRKYLTQFPKLQIDVKEMFGGLAFTVNGKMCINISGGNLMCRFDPALTQQVAKKIGFRPMIMKGKELKGYCYVEPIGFKNQKNFEYWMSLCLDLNEKAKSSKKPSRN